MMLVLCRSCLRSYDGMKQKVPFYKYPIWFLEIFTAAKSFESNPIIGNTVLNRLGLHVFRLILAHSLTGIRRFILGLRIPKKYRKEFREQGFILVEEALATEHFVALKNEAEAEWPEVRFFTQGDTTTEFVYLDHKQQANLPASKGLAQNSLLKNLMTYVAACGLTPWMDFLKVVNTGGSREGDPQKYFHSDTFHPTMKAWLFLEDVPDEKGPFEYIQGSNRLSLKRIKWEYRQSLGVKEEGVAYARRGSLRVDEAEAAKMGYGPVKSFRVKQNSLVIADTFGFHRRGEAAPNTSRLSMAFSNRINPFLPAPIPGLRAFDDLAEKLVNNQHKATTEVRGK